MSANNITVGQLRAALADLSDDTAILVTSCLDFHPATILHVRKGSWQSGCAFRESKVAKKQNAVNVELKAWE